MTTKSIRNWFFVHKWSSLICTLFLLMLCITGLPLIFGHEIEHLLGNAVEPPAMTAAPTASLDGMVRQVREARPNEAIMYMFQEEDEPEAWFVSMGKTADAERASSFFMFDSRTGQMLQDFDMKQGFIDIMFRLHYDMYAGLWGTLFLGFMGLLFVVALVSGVVIYGPYMRKLPFGSVRRERSPRAKWLDMHNLLGIVTLVWVFVVGFTGVINTLAVPIYGYWQSTDLAAMTARYRDLPPLSDHGSAEQARQTALATEPDRDIYFIAFPGNEFAGPHHYGVFMRGNTPLTAKLTKPVLIEAQTGKLTDTAEMPWYVSALLLSQPLHFGDYGGMPLKALWALLDILAIVVLGSGLYLWIKKRNIPIEARLQALQQRNMPDYALAKGETA
jgi:uncharacterized iron-regulated membrane protein